MLCNTNISLIVWLTGVEICLTLHVVMISLAHECLMAVLPFLGFALQVVL